MFTDVSRRACKRCEVILSADLVTARNTTPSTAESCTADATNCTTFCSQILVFRTICRGRQEKNCGRANFDWDNNSETETLSAPRLGDEPFSLVASHLIGVFSFRWAFWCRSFIDSQKIGFSSETRTRRATCARVYAH